MEASLFLESLNREDVIEPKLTIATLGERVNNHIRFFWTIAGVFGLWLAGISVVLYNISGDIGQLRLPQRLVQSSSHPDDPKNQAQAKKIIAEAMRTGTFLPDSVLRQAGKNFINAAQVNPKSWDVALQLLSYRSYLNQTLNLDEDAKPLTETSDNIRYDFELSPTGRVDLMMTGGAVPAERAAIHTEIGSEVSVGRGPATLILTGPGSAARLDNHHIKNVVFKGMRIIYRGGPVLIENVYFVNCTFDLPPSHSGQTLATAMIGTAAVSISLTS